MPELRNGVDPTVGMRWNWTRRRMRQNMLHNYDPPWQPYFRRQMPRIILSNISANPPTAPPLTRLIQMSNSWGFLLWLLAQSLLVTFLCPHLLPPHLHHHHPSGMPPASSMLNTDRVTRNILPGRCLVPTRLEPT